MFGDSLAAKRRVDEALDALRAGLTPYVSERMQRAFGDGWRVRVTRAAGREGDFTLDVYALLKTILDSWRDVFGAEPKLRNARSLVHLALDARNKMAHFSGALEPKQALRFLDAIHEVLRAVGAVPQEKLVSRLYDDQQSEMTSTARHLGQGDAAQPTRRLPRLLSAAQPTPPPQPPANAPAILAQSQADRIRQFVVDRVVTPARRRGVREITVRAGDVHRDMGLANAMPAVCSVLGGNKFAGLANVRLIGRSGPANGSNVYFRFALDEAPAAGVSPAPMVPSRPTDPVQHVGDDSIPDLDGALVLISCVKSKLPHSAPARSLYTSAWFTGVRNFVEARGAPWFLLSSRYGLVAPDAVIAPYDYTLNTLGVAERQAWARQVLEALLPQVAGYRRVVMFAGARYREFLVEALGQRGVSVDIPMEHLTRGEQLAWLARQSSRYPAEASDAPRAASVASSLSPGRLRDIEYFYLLLERLSHRLRGTRTLASLGEYRDWPRRGVYFFFEPSEYRSDSGTGPRVVRIGTHAVSLGSGSTLRQRLHQHRGNLDGTGNHRGSVFRLLLGEGLLRRGNLPETQSWSAKSTAAEASALLRIAQEELLAAELPVERAVSAYIGALPFLWLSVDDEPGPESQRAYIERNSIALLSNSGRPVLDPPSPGWLGRASNRARILNSGLWNQRHVDETHDPVFLDLLERMIGD